MEKIVYESSGKEYAKKLLTKELLEQLDRMGIPADEIIYIAASDMDVVRGFADGYVVIGKTKVARIIYPESLSVHQFAGYVQQNESKGEPAIQIFSFDAISEFELIREISSGVLLAKIDGTDQLWARFSNSRIGEFKRLVDNYKKLKNGEPLKSEDIYGTKDREVCPKCGMLYPDQNRKICPKCMDKKSIINRLAGYYKPYKKTLITIVCCIIATAILNMAYPYLAGTVLYDKVLAQNSEFAEWMGFGAGKFLTILLVVVISMVISKILLQASGMLQGYLVSQMVPEVIAKIKSQIFEAMGRLSVSFFSSRQTGGLMTRVLDDTNEITGFFLDGVPFFFGNMLTILITAIIMFSLNWMLAIAALCLIPVEIFISWYMMPRLWNFYGKRHRANRRLNSLMNDNLTGARVVKAFGRQEAELVRFSGRNKGVKNSEINLAKYDNRYGILYTVGENLASFAVWGIGATLIITTSDMELGVLITFASFVSQLNGPLDFLSFIFRWFTNCMNASQRIFEIMDAVPQVQEDENPVVLPEVKGDLVFDKVVFGYEPNKPILKNISFEVKAGQVLGIVGKSGAGKSTLVNLISRLYDPDEGSITLDGVDVRKLSFEQLRKSVAMVSQETYVFMGTVAENIAYARPDATRAEIIRAAKLASAHDFICKMPLGYDTIVGASGREMSGGERQRLSIARAILADPKILILDEATAAVDTETESAISKSLDQLAKGRTTLSIAHRLSTLKNADFLIVLDDGKLTEKGTHEELIDLKGTYYKLMELQTKALALRD